MYQNSRFLGVSHLSLMVLRWVTFLFKDQESLMSICLKIEYDSFLSDVLSVAEVGEVCAQTKCLTSVSFYQFPQHQGDYSSLDGMLFHNMVTHQYVIRLPRQFTLLPIIYFWVERRTVRGMCFS